jgi:predicted AAA+ superfamily ATPase
MFLIKRDLFKKLKAHLTKKEISFIVGPRQCGKTTLMWLYFPIPSGFLFLH